MSKMYDMMLIFFNSVKEDDLTKSLKRVESEIEKLDGKVLKTDVLGVKSFARPMQQKNSGQYVKMRFEVDSLKVGSLLARLKLNSDIFRVQIVVGTFVAPVEEKVEAVEEKVEAVEAPVSSEKKAEPVAEKADVKAEEVVVDA